MPAIGELEYQVAGIRRDKDYRHFVSNRSGHWHLSVLDDGQQILGWMASIAHPASRMIGPAVATNQEIAIALLNAELNYRRGTQMVFLVPVECDRLVQQAYCWGARNCELHVAQVRGEFQPFQGISMPTFMPETG